ncbi:MAG: hypothetical protein WD773_07835 [Gemmatimonadales bacterium]
MNRITNPPGLVQALLHGIDSHTPVEALLLDRERLIRIVRDALFDLHERRRRVVGTPAHPDVVRLIRYLDAVLGWAQEQPGQDLVLISRRA